MVTITPFDGMTPELKSGRALVIHAGETWYDAIAAGRFDFFPALVKALGLPAVLIRTERGASSRLLAMGRHLHVLIGPRAPIGPGIWHAHPGYLRGFWYLDPLGVNMHSSLVDAPYDAGGIDPARARWFWNGVTGWHLKRNLSKFTQEQRVEGGLAPARSVVFLQEIEHFARPVHWLDSETMLREVARHGPAYVKFHPAQSAGARDRLMRVMDDLPMLQVSTASVHDLAAASEVVVTQNSAAGFEALLQRKPVITCARADYHHATLIAHSAAELALGLQTARARLQDFAYDRYLWWHHGQHLLEPGKDGFAERVRERLGI